MDKKQTMTQAQFRVALAHWPKDADALRRVRSEVFIQEQNVPEDLEWDGIDSDCLHALALDSQQLAIGTGRLLPDGHIGRMAVLSNWRGKGVGAAILQYLLNQALRRGDQDIVLNAQISALDFYRRYGFEAYGETFLEADIMHQCMRYNTKGAIK